MGAAPAPLTLAIALAIAAATTSVAATATLQLDGCKIERTESAELATTCALAGYVKASEYKRDKLPLIGNPALASPGKWTPVNCGSPDTDTSGTVHCTNPVGWTTALVSGTFEAGQTDGFQWEFAASGHVYVGVISGGVIPDAEAYAWDAMSPHFIYVRPQSDGGDMFVPDDAGQFSVYCTAADGSVYVTPYSSDFPGCSDDITTPYDASDGAPWKFYMFVEDQGGASAIVHFRVIRSDGSYFLDYTVPTPISYPYRFAVQPHQGSLGADKVAAFGGSAAWPA